jgi:segregation and condensation protein B
MELLKQQIEALVFCSEQSISLEEIAASLKLSFDWDVEDEELIKALEEIKTKYSSDEYAFELIEISEGYQFLTKKQYHAAVSALIQHKAKKKLSVSQMETLAIIAYRQPISKGEVEHIRGVSCDYAIQKLLEKELVEITGKSDGPGRPIVYSTSRSFMDYFGIKSVKDLPQLKDIHVEQNEIGQPADLMTDDSGITENAELISVENETSLDVDSINEKSSESEATAEINSKEEKSGIEELSEETYEFAEPSPVTVLNDSDDNIFNSEISDPDLTNLPDRKSIFLGNEHRKEEEKSDYLRPEDEENL